MRIHHSTWFVLACLCFTAASLALAQAPKNTAGHRGTNSPAVNSAGTARGKKVFQEQCAVCHYATSAAKKIGPGLKRLTQRGKFSDGKKVDDASLREWIEKGGKNMPGFQETLTGEQVRELVAYLKTL